MNSAIIDPNATRRGDPYLPQRASNQTGLLAVSLLTLVAFAIAGYHPFVEDGGVYAGGIEKLLNPALFPTWTAFVTEHLRFSLFAPLVAALVHLTGLSLEWTLLLLYLLSIWTTLFAAWLLATRLTPSPQGRLAAVTLLAWWLTLPIAGTSLMLMDPYVTARSFTTPLTLLALAWALDALTSRAFNQSSGVPHPRRGFLAIRVGIGNAGLRKMPPRPSDPPEQTPRSKLAAWLPCAIAILIAATLHPLMAGYALAAVLCLTAVQTGKLWPPLLLLGTAIATAAILQTQAPAESPAYLSVAITRYYWFLSRWQWYEVLGLVAPLLIVAAFGKRGTAPRTPERSPTHSVSTGELATLNSRNPFPTQSGDSTEGQTALARTAFLLGFISLVVALLFAHEAYATHLVARLQPLRAFQIVYELMILTLGAWLGRQVLKCRVWRWSLLLFTLSAPMFFAQRSTFPSSAHIEWPNAPPKNPWQQAFLWIRANNPTDALFALDARYITQGRHEDAQCFRALAQRSTLPDYSKDGGEASITPALADQWAIGQAAQTDLEGEPDAMREAKLKPLGVTWAVLEASSQTAWACPYRNSTVKVCKLP